MKIGLSLSRCVRDIVTGTVDIDDVLVLIARTDFDPTVDKEWQNIWNHYQYDNPVWQNLDHGAVKQTVMTLWETGRVHQPRKFGVYPQRLPYYWVESVLPSTELDRYPAVQDAWNQFQTVAGLTKVKLESRF